MSVQRFIRKGADQASLRTVVEPTLLVGVYGSRGELDITLTDDTVLDDLKEALALLGYTFVSTAPPANNPPKEVVDVVELVGRAAAPAASAAGNARLYMDSTLKEVRVSQDAGAYVSAVSTSAIAEATSTITTTSSTDVVATGMTLTPAAGTYLVWFSSVVKPGNTDEQAPASIYVDGVQVAASERPVGRGGSPTFASQYGFCASARVTVNGTQAIEGRWRSTAGTATMFHRTLKILKAA
jgi:hypothetical protein